MSNSTLQAKDTSDSMRHNPRAPHHPRPWRRRLKRIAIGLIVAVLLFRVALSILLPSAIRKAADFYGLRCDYGRSKIGLLGGYAALWDVTVTPSEGGPALVSADFCEASISPSALLRGKLIVWRVGADGVKLTIERTADGEIPLLSKFSSPAAKPASKQPAAPAKELDLTAPLQVEAFRLTRVQAHVMDRSVQPAFDRTLNATIRVSDLGVADRPAQVDIEAWGTELLDSLRLNGEVRSVGRNAHAALTLYVRGVNPLAAAPYLRVLGVQPQTDDVNLSATLTASTSAVPGTLDALQGEAILKDVRLHAGDAEALRIAQITLRPKYIGPDRLDLGTLSVNDISAVAQRTASGHVAFAGLEYVGAAEATAPATRAATASASAPPAQPAQPAALPRVSLDAFSIENTRFALADQALPGSPRLELILNKLALTNLSTYAATQAKPVALQAEFTAPGIARTLTVSGQLDPFAQRKDAHLNVRVEGIRLEALQPYLAQTGLESEIDNGRFEFGLTSSFTPREDGILEGQIQLQNLSLVDAQELLRLSNAQISGCQIDPRTLEVRIAGIDLAGPRVDITRDAQGRLRASGFRTLLAGSAPQARPATRPTSRAGSQVTAGSPASLAFPIPRIQLDRFTWKDIRVSLRDQFVSPAIDLAVSDAGVEVRDIALNFRPTTRPATPGTITAWLKFPGVINDLNLWGTILPTPASLQIAQEVKAAGITTTALQPYLEPLGILPVLQEGTLQLKYQASARLMDAGPEASLRVQDVHLVDKNGTLAALGDFDLSSLRLLPEGIAIGRTAVVSPRLSVSRDEQGALVALGLKLAPQAAQPTRGAASRPAAESPRIPTLPAISLAELAVTDARLDWTDHLFQPAIQTSATSSLTLQNLDLGNADQPAQLKIVSSLAGTLDELLFDARLKTAPGAVELNSQLRLHNLRAGALEAYLPPTLATDLRSGELTLALSASARNHPEGGIGAWASINALDLREQSTDRPLFAFASAKAVASRFDPPAGVIALEELSLTGLRADAVRQPTGDFSFAGVRTTAEAPQGRPVQRPLATRPVDAGERQVADLLAAARQRLPEISLARLLVSADELRLSDLSRPASSPIAIEQLSLTNSAPLRWLGKDPQGQRANQLQLSMRVNPLVERLAASLEVAPFAPSPSARLQVQASGVRGAQLTRVLPELAGKVEGASLTDGRFSASADASLKVERRGPLQFDFRRGFTADVALHDIRWSNGEDPRVLAGIQELRANAIRIEPQANRVIIPLLEISTPTAYLSRDRAGLQLLGLTVPVASSSSADSAPAPAAPAPSAPAGLSATATAAASPSAMDLQVRRLTLSGLDLIYEDHAVSPPFTIPLNQLELEIQDFGTQSLREPKPIRFSAMLGTAKADLAKRGKRRLRAEDNPGMEKRELFSLATVNGAVSLYPQTNGWAKASLNGLELMGFRGAAQEAGVSLYDGLFDGEVDVRIRDNRRSDVRAKAVITDLSIDEPDKGPIARALKLQTPLGATIPLLEDADGSISLPVSFKVTDGQLSYGDIYGSAVSAAAQTVATAVASSPLRLAQGLAGGNEAQAARTPFSQTVLFSPGTALLDEAAIAKLDLMLRRLRTDRNAQLSIRHELSESDLSLASARANPAPQDALDLIGTLRVEKRRLLEEHRALSTRVQARLASNPEWALTDDLDQLRNLTRRIETCDTALDKLLDLQRPGAELQGDRRTRAMALEIAQARLDAVKRVLLAAPINNIEQRILLTPPSAQSSGDIPTGQVTINLVTRKR